MKNAVQVRPALPDDVPEIAALEAACFSMPWSRQSVKSAVERESCVFLVACTGGKIVGYISAECAFETAYINNTAVACEYRKSGLGGLLLDTLGRSCLACGAKTVTLEVRVSNHPARALYGGRGYRETGRRPGFYEKPCEDAILMEKSL